MCPDISNMHITQLVINVIVEVSFDATQVNWCTKARMLNSPNYTTPYCRSETWRTSANLYVCEARQI